MRADLVERAVWEDIATLLTDPSPLEQEYQRRLADKKKDGGWAHVEQLQTHIQKVKRGIGRLVDAYTEALIDREEFEPRIRQARQRLEKLQEQAQAQADEEAQYNELKLVIGGLQEFANRVQEGLQDANWSTRRQLTRTLVKQVEVDQKEVRIVYRVNPPPFVATPDSGGLEDCSRRKVVAFDTEGRDMPTFVIWVQPLPDLVWISPGDFFPDTQKPTVCIPLLDGTHKDYIFRWFYPGILPFGAAMHRLFHLLTKHGKHRRHNGEIPIRGKKRMLPATPERITASGHPFLHPVE